MIKSLPNYTSHEEALFDERETGSTHLPFQVEYELCQKIKNGDIPGVKGLLERTLSQEFLTGGFSSDPLIQAKYWSITVIATAVHYAILGGLDETDAYNLSDEYIRGIDASSSMTEMLEYLSQQAIHLTAAVHQSKLQPSMSRKMREACHYIHLNLHRNLTAAEVAAHVELSPSYFSVRFKKETGMSVHAYITSEKLSQAEHLLLEGRSIREICYTLGFSSQSHFTQLFKKVYHETPGRYVLMHAVSRKL